jgi:hypothetical protein
MKKKIKEAVTHCPKQRDYTQAVKFSSERDKIINNENKHVTGLSKAIFRASHTRTLLQELGGQLPQ